MWEKCLRELICADHWKNLKNRKPQKSSATRYVDLGPRLLVIVMLYPCINLYHNDLIDTWGVLLILGI